MRFISKFSKLCIRAPLIPQDEIALSKFSRFAQRSYICENYSRYRISLLLRNSKSANLFTLVQFELSFHLTRNVGNYDQKQRIFVHNKSHLRVAIGKVVLSRQIRRQVVGLFFKIIIFVDRVELVFALKYRTIVCQLFALITKIIS